MIVLELSDEQYKQLFGLLDRELRVAGLASLGVVVDLHNALQRAQVVEPKEEDNDNQEY